MRIPIIGFFGPITGAVGDFSVIKLGLVIAKSLHIGQVVFLCDEKAKSVFGRAEVLSIVTGQLKQLCLLHGESNYLETGILDKASAGERVFEFIQKVFGPHIATENKKATCIYLRRIDNGTGIEGSTDSREA